LVYLSLYLDTPVRQGSVANLQRRVLVPTLFKDESYFALFVLFNVNQSLAVVPEGSPSRW